MSNVILGLDPGATTTGFGLIEEDSRGQLKALDYGALPLNPTNEHSLNLKRLEEDLVKIIEKHEPRLISVERLFFFKNKKTALSVAEARGVILLTLRKANIAVKELTPLEMKQRIVGYGQATKKQIQFMVVRLTNLEETPKPDDAADALALAICCAGANKDLTTNNNAY